ncbi:DUF1534 domain-containing protein [Pseudomonas syringae pv. maculicola str. ES4326]|uniref:DUF1534 domain-containing protein n=1 Tax=Pseudomonas syringae pv. maculicola str. ES4326 TaxID=629265 RepID=A0A8T8CA81_PSEYM|nr:DUF1534 domain-containing protein [Pseudomonas syringae pv. maculicola str. ES4326]
MNRKLRASTSNRGRCIRSTPLLPRRTVKIGRRASRRAYPRGAWAR